MRRWSRTISALPAARTLDVACGTGYLTQHLRGSVTGLDQSASMVEIASARIPARHASSSADALPLPFADGEFERLFTGHFYGHLEEAARVEFLSEARRVAGELVVADSAIRPDHEVVEWQERVLNDGSRHEVYKRYFTGEGLAEELGGGEVLHAGPWFVVVRPPRGCGRGGAISGSRRGARRSAGVSGADPQSRPVSSSRSMPSAARMRGTVPCSAASRPRRMCSVPILVSPLRLASLTARSSPSLADVPQLGFVRRQLASRSTPVASIPTVPSTRSKSRDQRVAELLRLEADVLERVRGLAVAGRDRDQQVLGLDAARAQARGHARGLEGGVPRVTDESAEHPSTSWRVSCGPLAG